ncbi:MAG: glycosyltransferase family 9 protein [Pseudomonadota bacterium]
MEQPKRILVRSPNWLGDHIMALAFYNQIRRLFPESYLVCWYPVGLKGILPEKLFDEEWEFNKSDLKAHQKIKEWIEKIKGFNFDLSINLTASWSSALLFYRAKIPQRLGFSESGSQILLTRSQHFRGVKAGIHKSQIYLNLISLFGKERIPFEVPLNQTLRKTVPESFWVIAPGAALPLREWPFFPELIFEIKKRYPEKILKIVGTSVESAWKARIARWKLQGVEDWIEKTSLSELKDLCSRAELVLANDSGVAHLAATLGRSRTLVLFGPGNPNYIAPQGPAVLSIRAEPPVACSPCEKSYCRAPEGYQRCLREISVESVLSAIKSSLFL